MAARSNAWVCGRPLAEIVGSNPTGGMGVCLLWVLCLPGRSLCLGLITRPEESYIVSCVSECDREALIMRQWPTGGFRATERKNCYNECDDNCQYHGSRPSSVPETE
jgi:hypothetical protein